MCQPVLQVKNMEVAFQVRADRLEAVRKISLEVYPGEIVGLVGESGSGKSLAMKAVMGILPDNAERKAEVLRLGNQDLLSLAKKEAYRVRGKEMTMIFQDPMTALNPLRTVGSHLQEVILRHRKLSKAEAYQVALDILDEVGIPEPRTRMKQYPHEFSGGMRQRVLIAMALVCEPKLLIADEPTTALDVTIQAQILDLLKALSKKHGTAIIFITHDMGVIASICSRVYVMYSGKIMESGQSAEIFYQTSHPYTQALLKAIPDRSIATGSRLEPIEGSPPSLVRMPAGCPFAPRCAHVMGQCLQALPPIQQLSHTHQVACFLADPKAREVNNVSK